MTSPTPPAASSNVFEDAIGIFYEPSAVFARRREAGFGGPLLLLVLLTAAVTIATMGLTAPYWGAQFDLAMQQAAEKGQAMPEGSASDMARTAGRWFAVGGQIIGVPIFVLIGALFVMLGAKVAGTSLRYGQPAGIFTLAGFPRLLMPIAMAIQGLFAEPSSVRAVSDGSLGPARFFDPTTTSTVILSVLSNLDIVSIWSFVLVGLGIAVVGQTERSNGWVGAAVVFACTLALTLIPAALFGG